MSQYFEILRDRRHIFLYMRGGKEDTKGEVRGSPETVTQGGTQVLTVDSEEWGDFRRVRKGTGRQI